MKKFLFFFRKNFCFILLTSLFNFYFFGSSLAQPTLGFNKILQGLSLPVDIKNAGDGSKRLFIVEQTGTIKIYKNGSVLNNPFINVSGLIYSKGTNGLLGLAFPPNYKTTGYFFIYYNAVNGNVTLARYQRSTNNADIANPNSGVILFSYPKPDGLKGHNGGGLQFGKDGYLYISIGDGGPQQDPLNNAQNGKKYFGKILRLDVNRESAPYYRIPPDNPFVNNSNVFNEIFALGLRNPWRWSFDRKTGDMWIGDVGQDAREEVNFRTPSEAPGSNFGWRCYEGNLVFNRDSCKAKSRYVFPIFNYKNDVSNGGNSITGGYVYRGSAYPQLRGYYICADYVSANAWKIQPNGSGGWNIYIQKKVPSSIVSFGEDEDGELYASTLNGDVYQVRTTNNIASANVGSDISINDLPENNGTYIYPTLVDNKTINLVLKENYQAVRLIDMYGKELMFQTLFQHKRKFICTTTKRKCRNLYSTTNREKTCSAKNLHYKISNINVLN